MNEEAVVIGFCFHQHVHCDLLQNLIFKQARPHPAIAGGGKSPSKDDDDDVSICNNVSLCSSENNTSEFICFDAPTSIVTFGVTLSVDLDEN